MDNLAGQWACALPTGLAALARAASMATHCRQGPAVAEVAVASIRGHLQQHGLEATLQVSIGTPYICAGWVLPCSHIKCPAFSPSLGSHVHQLVCTSRSAS